jgi:transposase
MSKINESGGDQEQFWQMAIETWRASGLSVRQFCTKEGLSEPSFYSWRKKLAGDDSERDNQDKAESSTFIEVAIPQNNSAAIELLLISGNTLRIPAGVDSATLNTILSVAHAAGLC